MKPSHPPVHQIELRIDSDHIADLAEVMYEIHSDLDPRSGARGELDKWRVLRQGLEALCVPTVVAVSFSNPTLLPERASVPFVDVTRPGSCADRAPIALAVTVVAGERRLGLQQQQIRMRFR